MGAEANVQSVQIEDDRVGVGSDGTLAAIVFVVVSVLLIATLPAQKPGERAADRPVVEAVAPPAGLQP
jgi:hypothetical protein